MPCLHKFESSAVPLYERCSECGSYRSTAPEDPKTLYDADYWSSEEGRSTLSEQIYNVGIHEEFGQTKNGMVLAAIAAQFDKSFMPTESVLEIGCAPGSLLGRFRDLGFHRIVGIETERSYEADIRKIADAPADLHFGFFPELTIGWPDDDFSCIVALDLFEHIPTPAPFLWECHRLLKQSGLLVMMMPILSEDAPMPERFFNAREHIWVHSKAHMDTLLADAHFTHSEYSQWCPGHDLVLAVKI